MGIIGTMELGYVAIDQDMLLDQAQTQATKAAHLMKGALESNNLREGLKQAAIMLGVLRAGNLSPKTYYLLCKEKLRRNSHASVR